MVAACRGNKNQPNNLKSRMSLPRNPTRPVKIGSVTIGDGHPIMVQSMCATRTTDVEATAAQVTKARTEAEDVLRARARAALVALVTA